MQQNHGWFRPAPISFLLDAHWLYTDRDTKSALYAGALRRSRRLSPLDRADGSPNRNLQLSRRPGPFSKLAAVFQRDQGPP